MGALRSHVASGVITMEGPEQDVAEADVAVCHLRAHHVATWSEGAGSLLGRPVNSIQNPMEQKWPFMHFLNPDELVMGHIIINDSRKAMRRPETEKGCVRANACRLI